MILSFTKALTLFLVPRAKRINCQSLARELAKSPFCVKRKLDFQLIDANNFLRVDPDTVKIGQRASAVIYVNRSFVSRLS